MYLFGKIVDSVAIYIGRSPDQLTGRVRNSDPCSSRSFVLRDPEGHALRSPWQRTLKNTFARTRARNTHACITATAPSSPRQRSQWVSEPSSVAVVATVVERFAGGYLTCCCRKSTIVDDTRLTGLDWRSYVTVSNRYNSRKFGVSSRLTAWILRSFASDLYNAPIHGSHGPHDRSSRRSRDTVNHRSDRGKRSWHRRTASDRLTDI